MAKRSIIEQGDNKYYDIRVEGVPTEEINYLLLYYVLHSIKVALVNG